MKAVTEQLDNLNESVLEWAEKQAALYKQHPEWLDSKYDREVWADTFLEQDLPDVGRQLGLLMAIAFERECLRQGVELPGLEKPSAE